MEVDDEEFEVPTSSNSRGPNDQKKRFEVKKVPQPHPFFRPFAVN
jgi:hypothetical protein